MPIIKPGHQSFVPHNAITLDIISKHERCIIWHQVDCPGRACFKGDRLLPAGPDESGRMHFRDDVYGHDDKTARKMFL